MTSTPSSAPGLPIAAVERDTGLSKDTLRVWERRYGFPQPSRDSNGERVYPPEQVDKLRLLKRLMDQGHRPGKIAERSIEQLQALAEAGNGRPATASMEGAPDDALRLFLQMIVEHRVDDLRRELALLTVKAGLARFVTDVIAPLTALVGEAWARGELAIFEEHLYTESVQGVLRNAITSIPHPGDSPRVLLTTVPQEPHGLGVLMAEAMFALEGARCVALGRAHPGDGNRARRGEPADRHRGALVLAGRQSVPGDREPEGTAGATPCGDGALGRRIQSRAAAAPAGRGARPRQAGRRGARRGGLARRTPGGLSTAHRLCRTIPRILTRSQS